MWKVGQKVSDRTQERCLNIPHLNQLHEVLKVLLFVDGELPVVVDDAVVLHLAVAADAQGVIPGIVGALPHQEQARLRRVEEPLGLLPSYLPVKPPTRREKYGRWGGGVRGNIKRKEKDWSED